MTFLSLLIVYIVIGAMVLKHYWREEETLTLDDMLEGLFILFTWPIFMAVIAVDWIERHGNAVVWRRKKCEKQKRDGFLDGTDCTCTKGGRYQP